MRAWHAISLMVLGVTAAGLLAVHLRGQAAAAGPVARTTNSFEFTVHAPFKTVVPLFGAWEERAWAGGHWDPHFLYPLPERDQAGEVFTVAHRQGHSIWVNTLFDLEAGRIQYVYVVPEAQVAVIDVYARPLDASTTSVKVVYQRTALDPALNDHIREQGRHDAASGPEWESAINSYLKAHRP